MRRTRSWLLSVSAWLVLLALGGATEGVAYGPEGGFCLPALPLTKAIEDGPKRSYAWEGVCSIELASGPSVVNVEVKAVFDGTDRKASENIKVTGPITGKFQTTTRGCTKDPFVVGAPSCAGPAFANLDGIVPGTVVPPAKAAAPPIMENRVPANQAYTTAPRPLPPGAGQVKITKPVTQQKFWFDDNLAVEVRFVPASPAHPPNGGVGIAWGQEIGGTCTYGGGYVGVQHYTMAQMLGKSSFPFPGRYCLRATSKPGQGPVSAWTEWAPPVRIEIVERVAAKSPGGSSGGLSEGGEQSGQGGAGKAIARLPGPAVDDVARQLQALEGRIMRLGTHAEAAKLLRDVQAYRSRLDQEPNDVTALQKRLRELTLQVSDLEASVKNAQPRKPTIGPAAKPTTGSQ